ncbi:MAG: YpdA family putative bacillithiol disulfide reductase [bacterium]
MGAEETVFDVLVVGAGPIGIACGMEASRSGLSHVIIEKGCLTDAVYQFPAQLVFFSTADLLELGNFPFIISGSKPTRGDILNYYKRVAQHFRLNTHLFERVENIRREGDVYCVISDKSRYAAKNIVLAIGFYDHPKMLNIAGENLPKVSHYYRESHFYYDQNVAVIGGGNSGVEAALELYRGGAKKVTFIHRQESLNSSIKYWILPDFQNRVKEGSIEAHFSSNVIEIKDKTIVIQKNNGETFEIDNDFVLAMTGYHTDFDFLARVGVETEDTAQRKPVHDPETMETNMPNMYIAGVATGGMNTNKIFIENGRVHAKRIVEDIVRKMKST